MSARQGASLISLREATDALDWTLGAACLQVTIEGRTAGAGSLDEALASHLAYLAQSAPFLHAGICSLLYLEATPHSANWDLLVLAGRLPPQPPDPEPSGR